MVMGYKELNSKQQQKTIRYANAYFDRIKEILLFLETDRGVINMRAILPRGFFITRVYDISHLAVQRSGSTYDGKYYIVDIIAKYEKPTSIARFAEYSDIWHAFTLLEELEKFIHRLDESTANQAPTP
jgi:hypothetical protein